MVIGIGIASIFPFFHPGFFPMHDDTQVARVVAMGNALKEGQFPVRWVSDLGYGYGYPIFHFYGPLPYYVGGLLYALGAAPLAATKAMMALGFIAPAVILFFVVYPVIGWQGAVASALFFLFAPYHAVQGYVRGAVGEFWVLNFWPLILFAVWNASGRQKRPAMLIIGAVGIAGAVLSHTLMGFVTVLFTAAGILAYGIWSMVRRAPIDRVMALAGMLLLGLGLSAFFWLPAFAEMGYTNVAGQVSATADYRDHFVCLPQLWSSLWGFGGSIPGCIDGMSFVLGKVHVLAALLGVLTMVVNPRLRVVSGVGVALSIIGIGFSTGYTAAIWSIIPFFPFLQYPWRFLSVAALGLSLLVGVFAAGGKRETHKTLLLFVLIGSLLFFNLKWFAPQQYRYDVPEGGRALREDMRWRVSKISDEYLPADISRPQRDSMVVFATIPESGGIRVTTLTETATEGQYMVESSVSAQLTVNKAYFPGWQYFVNDVPVEPVIRNSLPRLSIEAGQSVIALRFRDTPVRIAGNLISLVTLLALIAIPYGKQRKKTNR